MCMVKNLIQTRMRIHIFNLTFNETEKINVKEDVFFVNGSHLISRT